MQTYKAVFVDYVRKELKRDGRDLEPELLKQLSEADRQEYRSLLPVSWISPELGGRLLEAFGPVLFPTAVDPVFEIGRGQARNDMTGIYRILLKVATVPMVINRAATLFGTYHKTGKASLEHVDGEKRGAFFINEYPDLSDGIRRTVGGYIMGLLELTGVKEIKVHLNDSNPNAWRWDISWN